MYKLVLSSVIIYFCDPRERAYPFAAVAFVQFRIQHECVCVHVFLAVYDFFMVRKRQGICFIICGWVRFK